MTAENGLKESLAREKEAGRLLGQEQGRTAELSWDKKTLEETCDKLLDQNRKLRIEIAELSFANDQLRKKEEK